MSYEVRSKSGTHRVRDGVGHGSPMLTVGDGAWVTFENLPAGHEVGEDHDLIVRVATGAVSVPSQPASEVRGLPLSPVSRSGRGKKSGRRR